MERDILTNNLLYYRKFIDNFTDYYRIIDELFIGINKIVYFKSEDPFNLSWRDRKDKRITGTNK